jgi:hypothetical protein
VVDEEVDLWCRAGYVAVGVEVGDALLGEDVLARQRIAPHAAELATYVVEKDKPFLVVVE